MESKKYSNLTGEQMKIVHQYCDNNMQKLKQTCYPIIIKIGGISQKDYDDLYSLAQVVFLDSLLNYNEKICQFHPFLVSSLKKRLYSTYIRDRNRKKRSVVMKDDEGNDVWNAPKISGKLCWCRDGSTDWVDDSGNESGVR